MDANPTTPAPAGAAAPDEAVTAMVQSAGARRQTVDPVRRALAPSAVVGPLLCAVLLITVQLVARSALTSWELVGEAAALLAALSVNLMVSRRAAVRLMETQLHLAGQVAARRTVEADLSRSVHDLSSRQAFLSALVDTMDVEVVAVDTDGRTVLWNQALRRASGAVDFDDAKHSALRASLFAADGVTALQTEDLPVLRALAGERVHGEEIVVRASGQAVRRLLMNAVPIHLPDGALAGAVAAGQDITVLRAQQDELARRNRDLDAVARATSAVLAGADARAAICRAAREVTDALVVLLFEPDPTGQRLVAAHAAGLDLPELVIRVDSTSLTARTYRTAKTQLVVDLAADPGTDQAVLALFRSLPDGDRLRSAVFVPVVHDGRTRAVLAVTLPRPLPVDQTRMVGLLELLAADAALALSREDLLSELARHSFTDALTGLANRRRWDTDLAREIDRATRTGSPLSVITLDLDHFKAYNDTHGHPAGDSLLTETATAWLRLLRADDVIARLGGEEFAVLLPDCTDDDAGQLADKMLRAVPHGQTSSAGITQWAGDTAETFLTRADQALYAAKHNGRSRSHTASDQPSPPTRPENRHLRLQAPPRSG